MTAIGLHYCNQFKATAKRWQRRAAWGEGGARRWRLCAHPARNWHRRQAMLPAKPRLPFLFDAKELPTPVSWRLFYFAGWLAVRGKLVFAGPDQFCPAGNIRLGLIPSFHETIRRPSPSLPPRSRPSTEAQAATLAEVARNLVQSPVASRSPMRTATVSRAPGRTSRRAAHIRAAKPEP